MTNLKVIIKALTDFIKNVEVLTGGLKPDPEPPEPSIPDD
jgi:hypothetical protein